MENLLDMSQVEETLSLSLTRKDAGKLIGFGGENIKNIREKFKNTVIVVNREYPRVVQISGSKRVNTYGYILMFLRN